MSDWWNHFNNGLFPLASECCGMSTISAILLRASWGRCLSYRCGLSRCLCCAKKKENMKLTEGHKQNIYRLLFQERECWGVLYVASIPLHIFLSLFPHLKRFAQATYSPTLSLWKWVQEYNWIALIIKLCQLKINILTQSHKLVNGTCFRACIKHSTPFLWGFLNMSSWILAIFRPWPYVGRWGC